MIEKKICIFGSTSQIAKGLIYSFLNKTSYYLYLFARSIKGVNNFIENNSFESNRYTVSIFDSFNSIHYDVIINCIGIGDPVKLKEAGNSIFYITEYYDNIILDYLKNHQATLYINFSSGAVYGTSFEAPIVNKSLAEIPINNINDKEYYRIVKLYSEAKHRSFKGYNIVDLRVFSYFSRFIDLSTNFLMTEIVNAIINNNLFVTNDINIVRDYIHPFDLFTIVNCCIQKKKINDVFDAYSESPVEKFRLLDILKDKFGLTYKVDKSAKIVNATGVKNIYYSENRHAELIGYEPEYNSVDTIVDEMQKLLLIEKIVTL